VLDATTDTGSRNVRMISAAVLDLSSNFEVIHGLLDLIMVKINAISGKHYKLVQDDSDPRFFPTRGVSVLLNGAKVGSIGVIHPEVLGNFELKYPVSALELDFDALFEHFKNAH